VPKIRDDGVERANFIEKEKLCNICKRVFERNALLKKDFRAYSTSNNSGGMGEFE